MARSDRSCRILTNRAPEKLHASLALLPVDPRQVEYLENAPPRCVARANFLSCEKRAQAASSSTVAAKMWTELRIGQEPMTRVLTAAGAPRSL